VNVVDNHSGPQIGVRAGQVARELGKHTLSG